MLLSSLRNRASAQSPPTCLLQATEAGSTPLGTSSWTQTFKRGRTWRTSGCLTSSTTRMSERTYRTVGRTWSESCWTDWWPTTRRPSPVAFPRVTPGLTPNCTGVCGGLGSESLVGNSKGWRGVETRGVQKKRSWLSCYWSYLKEIKNIMQTLYKELMIFCLEKSTKRCSDIFAPLHVRWNKPQMSIFCILANNKKPLNAMFLVRKF